MNPTATAPTGSYIPRHAHQPRGKRLWCPTCDNDLHLEVESPTISGRQEDTLAVAILCPNCHKSRVLDTTAEHLAALPTGHAR
ncbi:RNase P subunit RPR2 [Arthrobacter sp. SORGH_AS 212]|nr:RNase P subunit RPR2 [Arthrobacter sp. SORGH_AS_0212]